MSTTQTCSLGKKMQPVDAKEMIIGMIYKIKQQQPQCKSIRSEHSTPSFDNNREYLSEYTGRNSLSNITYQVSIVYKSNYKAHFYVILKTSTFIHYL